MVLRLIGACLSVFDEKKLIFMNDSKKDSYMQLTRNTPLQVFLLLCLDSLHCDTSAPVV